MGGKRKTVAKSTAAADEENSALHLGTSSSHKKLPSQTAVEGTNTENNVPPNSKRLPGKWKASMATNEPPRRSGRLKKSAQIQGIKPVVDHVDLREIEKEELPQPEKVNSPLQVVNEKSSEVETQVEHMEPPKDADDKGLNETVGYLIRGIDEIKHKGFERLDGGPSSDVCYKSLYLDLQKKLEALMEDNYKLVRKLVFAEGQVAAYEKMIDAMGALK